MTRAFFSLIVRAHMTCPVNESGSQRALRVLVVEDNDVVRNVLVAWIKKEGMNVKSAVNGREALQMWGDALIAFDVLITDHAMPLMNGLELVRQIRESGIPAAELKVIVYSGGLTLQDIASYRALRTAELFEKPCLPQRLISAIIA